MEVVRPCTPTHFSATMEESMASVVEKVEWAPKPFSMRWQTYFASERNASERNVWIPVALGRLGGSAVGEVKRKLTYFALHYDNISFLTWHICWSFPFPLLHPVYCYKYTETVTL